ncbi:hypothetical protein P691DRAFT_775051 [Macrolepiota fuliginosa MF-IS2]|uniref:Chromo domain-containing protein n=1 Tax=Macrolepiota fuliginosa MF-IS2 TaxID=1400762 RepID=A0A9P5XDE0_9AGAR|nr:hypothetical protein P691DRAFT_775051 [Macrolepiota fuliginosa MF-IS2]
MAHRSPELVESEDENAMNVDKVEKATNGEGSEAGEEDGSEYEIEEILDAKRGAFPEGRMGYLVKWKGYGEEENSWVDERDTENAKELVNEFWKKNPKKKPRKSVEPKATKRARKSLADGEESDNTSTVVKRGRKSTARMDSEDVDEEPTRTKKSRKVEKPSAKGRVSEEPQQRLQDMAKYMDRESWEDLVDTVDTVERTDEGLIIYFTLRNGDQIREKGGICRKRFPQKLLSFYESNLKWRAAEANVDD